MLALAVQAKMVQLPRIAKPRPRGPLLLTPRDGRAKALGAEPTSEELDKIVWRLNNFSRLEHEQF